MDAGVAPTPRAAEFCQQGGRTVAWLRLIGKCPVSVGLRALQLRCLPVFQETRKLHLRISLFLRDATDVVGDRWGIRGGDYRGHSTC